MVTHREAPHLERPRPIVRSSRLVHRGTVALGAHSQVLAARDERFQDDSPPEASKPAHKRFRFARPLVVATVLSASLARADAPGGTLMLAEPSAEVLDLDTAIAAGPRPEELELAPRIGQTGASAGVLAEVSKVGVALGPKVDGTKDNPYEGKGLVKRVPRAKRMAWKRIYEEGAGYEKVSELKGNPYE